MREGSERSDTAWVETFVVVLCKRIFRTGVVGLCIARSLLEAGLEVALIERSMPCAGATGAGEHKKVYFLC